MNDEDVDVNLFAPDQDEPDIENTDQINIHSKVNLKFFICTKYQCSDKTQNPSSITFNLLEILTFFNMTSILFVIFSLLW